MSTLEFQPIGIASERVIRRAALREPIVVAEFWANRRGESVRIQLREFEGTAIVDARRFYTGRQGRLLPTSKGLALSVRRLPELAAGITKALARAYELGLLKAGQP